jgi:hypothetical protein
MATLRWWRNKLFWLRDDDGFSANAGRRAWRNYGKLHFFWRHLAFVVQVLLILTHLRERMFLEITSAGVLDLNQGQIKFPATQVPSADANTLDDYEEGTWTPTISFGGASVGVTYAAGRAGQYTKIGRQVTVTAYILLTSKGSSTGAARISGLPFTITNESGYYAAGSLGALVDITYGGQIQTYAEIGSTSYVLNDYSEAGVQGNTTDADFSNVSQIIFTATYYA